MNNKFYFNKEQEMFRMAIRDFVNKEVNPNMDRWEKEGILPLRDIFKKMGDLGFLGVRYNEKYGGEGLDYWYELVFYEEIAHCHGGSLPMAIAVQINSAIPCIYEVGSEYLKENYLKPAIKGEKVAALAVTESHAGSDVSGIKTIAEKKDDFYIINGSKIFITNGVQADFITLLAKTRNDMGHKNFSLFVVPADTPGFKVGKKLDKIGMYSSDTAELFFDNMKIPKENLIGEEGKGFIYQMQQFQHERFVVLPMSYIAVGDMIKLTIEHLKQRTAFGKPLIEKQVLRHRLALWLAEAEALQAFAYHIVKMKMENIDVTKEVSMGKLLAAQLVNKVADGCVQMFGGSGFMSDMLISRYYRDFRLMSIGGGTDEIMCEIISKISLD